MEGEATAKPNELREGWDDEGRELDW
jgi:hypothetical protein